MGKSKNRGLMAKLTIVILLIVIIPATVIGVFATKISSDAIKSQLSKSKNTLALQTSNFVDAQIKHIEDVFFQITISPEFRDALVYMQEYPGMDEIRLSQWKLDKVNAIGLLTRSIQTIAVSDKYMDDITIIMRDGTLAGSRASKPVATNDYTETDTYKNITGHEDLVWLDPSQADLSVIKEGLLAGKRAERWGSVVYMELNYESFENMLAEVDIGDTDISYLIAPNGTVISPNPYDAEANAVLKTSPLILTVEEKAAMNDAGSFIMDVDGIPTIVTYNRSDESGFIYLITISEEEVLADPRQIRNMIIILGAVFMVLAVLGGVVFTNSMTRALKKVMESMSRAADGDLTSTIRIKRKDEIGTLAYMFNVMVSGIRELIAKSISIASKVDGSAGSLAVISEESTKAASEIANAINDVAIGASKQNEEVINSVKIVDGLAGTVNDVVSSTTSMETSASQVKTYTVEGIRLAGTLSDKALKVRSVTSDVVVMIGDLSKSIANINQINSVLNEISDMTKLLSLNASIEAARAGESGRGFMVVAEEIGKLAEQSYKHTSEIESLVSGVLDKTENTAKFIQDADKTIIEQTNLVKDSVEYFDKIDYAIDELMRNIADITDSILDIDKDKELVLDSIKNISEISEMAAASSEEVSASTQQQLSSIQELNGMATTLNEYSYDLEETLKRFLIDGNDQQ